jgi:hypothetical protein
MHTNDSRSNELSLYTFDPEKMYWIMCFPYHYSFVFYGTVVEAQELFKHRCEFEGTGTLRRADPNNRQDSEMVRDEILNVRIDRQNGIKDLPYLPGRGWL